jgi:hypothetical protein
MQSTLRRVAAVAACCVAVLAVSVASASADGPPVVTTGPATNVTATTAILNGVVTANGSTTSWQFAYGQSQPTLKLAPQQAGIIGATGTNVPVSVQVTGLTPGTTYAFTLLAGNASNFGKYAYYGLFTAGKTVTFTTAPLPGPGRLVLASKKVKVSKGHAAISLRCASVNSCAGRVTITAHAKLRRHGRTKTFTCVKRAKFSIPAGKKRTIHPRVSHNCLVALRIARHHRFKARLTATTHTGQPRLAKTVTVTR